MKTVKQFGIFVLSLILLSGCGATDATVSSGQNTTSTGALTEPIESEDESTAQSAASASDQNGSNSSETSGSTQETIKGSGSGSADGSSEDTSYYSLIPDFTKAEVEAFALKAKECVVSQDWDGFVALIGDSVTADGDTYSIDEFKSLDFSNVNAEFISAIQEESCQDMFSNWQGVMMADGQIWISEVENENGENVLCITSINGMLS